MEISIVTQLFKQRAVRIAKSYVYILMLLPAFFMFMPETNAAGRHADISMEALLPETLGGVALTVESQAGTDLTIQSEPFDLFLKNLNRTRADFTLASAYAQGGLKAAVGAWRVKGADPALLLPGFQATIQASSKTQLAKASEAIGGRTVVRIGDPGQLTQGPLYVYVNGDTLYFVQTPERPLALEAIEKLPN